MDTSTGAVTHYTQTLSLSTHAHCTTCSRTAQITVSTSHDSTAVSPRRPAPSPPPCTDSREGEGGDIPTLPPPHYAFPYKPCKSAKALPVRNPPYTAGHVVTLVNGVLINDTSTQGLHAHSSHQFILIVEMPQLEVRVLFSHESKVLQGKPSAPVSACVPATTCISVYTSFTQLIPRARRGYSALTRLWVTKARTRSGVIGPRDITATGSGHRGNS
ncbi:hypothetical protein J6590_012027 [Homalodisca vitripennis]|nr:hypothetical protein J6590_012027 [Homalodisca vitripennis]